MAPVAPSTKTRFVTAASEGQQTVDPGKMVAACRALGRGASAFDRNSVIRRFILRGLAVVIAACAIALLALMATWAWRGGPEGALGAAVRMLRQPTPTVYDVRHQPSRPLAASATPLNFGASRHDVALPPMVQGAEGRRMPLQQLVYSTDTLAFVVIQNDSIVFERYATEHGGAGVSHYRGVSDAIVAALVGMAIDDGILRAVDDPVTAYVPELASRGFSKVTLRQLLDTNADLAEADGIKPFLSDANFIFIEAGKNFQPISKALRNSGIVVKELGNVASHRGCMRVTIGTREMNDKFLQCVEGSL